MKAFHNYLSDCAKFFHISSTKQTDYCRFAYWMPVYIIPEHIQPLYILRKVSLTNKRNKDTQEPSTDPLDTPVRMVWTKEKDTLGNKIFSA